MNNLVLTKKRIQKVHRLRAAQLATFKKGIFTSYKPSVYVERQKQISEEVSDTNS